VSVISIRRMYPIAGRLGCFLRKRYGLFYVGISSRIWGVRLPVPVAVDHEQQEAEDTHHCAEHARHDHPVVTVRKEQLQRERWEEPKANRSDAEIGDQVRKAIFFNRKPTTPAFSRRFEHQSFGTGSTQSNAAAKSRLFTHTQMPTHRPERHSPFAVQGLPTPRSSTQSPKRLQCLLATHWSSRLHSRQTPSVQTSLSHALLVLQPLPSARGLARHTPQLQMFNGQSTFETQIGGAHSP